MARFIVRRVNRDTGEEHIFNYSNQVFAEGAARQMHKIGY